MRDTRRAQSQPVGKWVVLGLATVLIGCNNHLDFGVGNGSGGSGGSIGTGGSGTSASGGNAPDGGGGSGGGPSSVSCTADGDCRLSSLHCDVTGSKTCVACVADANCTTAALPHCDVTLHRCVACVLANQCAASQTCVANRCMTTCTDVEPTLCPASTSCEGGVCGSCADDGIACASATGTPFCLNPPRVCVGCRTNADCTAAARFCDPVSNTCVACTSSAECPSTTPLCDPGTGRCSAG